MSLKLQISLLQIHLGFLPPVPLLLPFPSIHLSFFGVVSLLLIAPLLLCLNSFLHLLLGFIWDHVLLYLVFYHISNFLLLRSFVWNAVKFNNNLWL